jgi:hypothetical protein
VLPVCLQVVDSNERKTRWFEDSKGAPDTCSTVDFTARANDQ